MRKLRADMDRRMLGNGYCARPVAMACQPPRIRVRGMLILRYHHRVQTHLRRQRDNAAAKGQIGRQRLFDSLLARLETDAS